ncbi:MAG: tetratricopeptide repeat protein [Candidatus Parcubacteria bacterium]|nr:tetratricopeptide repeat protein [Candidatus Parcubacteria bacterium]
MQKDILIWSVSAIALLLASGGAWYYYARTPGGAVTQYPVSNTPAVILEKQNQEYALAKNYQKSGDYSSALKSYQKALTESQDAFQKTQIAFNIAYTNELLGKYTEAIAQFKAITADTSNYAIARAASIQDIGLMYYTYSGSTTLQTIVSETFKDPPYDSFKKADDLNLNMAYIKLFEYAASIYPLANSEVRIAYGYVNELLDTFKGATTTPQGKEYLSIITQSLQATGRDLVRMKDVPEERTLIPEILVREGKTFDRLATLGVVDPQQAEPYFQSGMQYAGTLGAKPGNFHALNYAFFLVDRYGNERAVDIKSLLTPFRVGNEAEIYSIVIDFYKNTRINPVSDKNRKTLVKLGQMDQDFELYLISLGWKQTDF